MAKGKNFDAPPLTFWHDAIFQFLTEAGFKFHDGTTLLAVYFSEEMHRDDMVTLLVFENFNDVTVTNPFRETTGIDLLHPDGFNRLLDVINKWRDDPRRQP